MNDRVGQTFLVFINNLGLECFSFLEPKQTTAVSIENEHSYHNLFRKSISARVYNRIENLEYVIGQSGNGKTHYILHSLKKRKVELKGQLITVRVNQGLYLFNINILY